MSQEGNLMIGFYKYVMLFCFVLFNYSLKGMRAKVWQARTESPLFDCKQYAQGMEMLFSRMWDRHAAGLKPDHVAAISEK